MHTFSFGSKFQFLNFMDLHALTQASQSYEPQITQMAITGMKSQIGIGSCQPSIPIFSSQASTVDSFTEFTQKMLENYFNYASSFAVNPTLAPLDPSETYIPSKALQQ